MALTQITSDMLTGKGVLGQADVPGLSTSAMQAAVEQITREVVIPVANANAAAQDAINAQILRRDNTDAFTPTDDYQPATKKYADDLQIAAGSVASVFGRTGNVVARAGDYNGAQVVMTGYAKPAETAAIDTTDSVSGALGKLEKALDGKAAALHAASHASGGADALTPASIGAATPIAYSTASSDAITLVDNTIITRTGATAVTITYPTGNYICTVVLTFAASGSFSVTFPAGTTYLGSIPTWTASVTYEISIRDGVAAIGEVGDGT